MTRSSSAMLLVLAAASIGTAGCSGDARRGARGARDADPAEREGNAREGSPRDAGHRPGGAEVSLSDADLAPMDAYIRRSWWILGDEVEIVASKEYFVQNLSISARIGYVKREDAEGANEATSTLTFLGTADQVDFSTAPRVLIGTGITVSARKRIVLRFVRTTDPDLPVRLRIAANGKARTGTREQVARREESIVVGAQLRRMGSAYRFEEQ